MRLLIITIARHHKSTVLAAYQVGEQRSPTKHNNITLNFGEILQAATRVRVPQTRPASQPATQANHPHARKLSYKRFKIYRVSVEQSTCRVASRPKELTNGFPGPL